MQVWKTEKCYEEILLLTHLISECESDQNRFTMHVCISYPEALKMAGLQQVSQKQDLSDGVFLLL